MKRRSTFPPLVILILTTFALTNATSAALTPDHGPSASGSGLFRFLDPVTERSELWSFSFEAVANKNGQTRGRAEFENLTDQTRVVVRINCLSVDSAFAVISGIVLHSDNPDLPKKINVVFAASDGQLLPVPGLDTITPPFSFPGQDCHDGQPLTILPVEDGDIHIQP